MSVDWKAKFFELYHVSRNMQLMMQVEGEARRKSDKALRVFGEQLEGIMTEIPDEAIGYETGSKNQASYQKGSEGI